MDTVHPIVEDLSLLSVGDNITGFNTIAMKQTGIGGDDKVGIFIALSCLMKYDNIKIAFFRDEEVGCQGSYDADLEFFNDCSFVLQCDRRGNKDFVTTASGVELSSYHFQNSIQDILTTHGYTFSSGMMTDVMALKENGLRTSCANISCGYYNPHMENEYVNVPDVMNCLSLVCSIIEKCGNKKFKHTYKADNWWRFANTKGIGKKQQKVAGVNTPKVYNDWEDWDYSYKDMDWCNTCGAYELKNALNDKGQCKYCQGMHNEHPQDKCFSCDEFNVLEYDQHYGVYLCAKCKTTAFS
jgi:hypothetical protein